MKHNRISLLLLGIVIGGCAQSTAPQQTILPSAWKNPSIGAEFTTEGSYEDSSQYGISSGPFQDMYQVTDSNLTIGGKTHVNELIFDGGEIIYTTYEANGDFSIGDSSYNGSATVLEWTTFPIASAGTLSDPPVDSVIADGDIVRSNNTRTFVDKETITIGSTPFQAVRIDANYQSTETGPNYPNQDIQNSVLLFVPEIGFFGKETYDEVSSSAEYENGNYITTEDHCTSQSELSMYANVAAPPAPSGKSATPQGVSQNESSKLLKALLLHRFNKIK